LDVKSSGFITLDNWDPQAFRVLMEFRETLGGEVEVTGKILGKLGEIFDPPKFWGVFPGSFWHAADTPPLEGLLILRCAIYDPVEGLQI